MQFQFEAVCGPKFILFWDDVGDSCSCQRTYPIVYVVFRSEAIGRYLPFSYEVAEIGPQLLDPKFLRGISSKIFYSCLLP